MPLNAIREEVDNENQEDSLISEEIENEEEQKNIVLDFEKFSIDAKLAQDRSHLAISKSARSLPL